MAPVWLWVRSEWKRRAGALVDLAILTGETGRDRWIPQVVRRRRPNPGIGAGGTITIDSAQGRGTTVGGRIPR